MTMQYGKESNYSLAGGIDSDSGIGNGTTWTMKP